MNKATRRKHETDSSLINEYIFILVHFSSDNVPTNQIGSLSGNIIMIFSCLTYNLRHVSLQGYDNYLIQVPSVTNIKLNYFNLQAIIK